jgi:hypothetical protein
MPARNNRGIVTIQELTRTTVAMERLCTHVSAETNSRNRRAVFCAVRAKGYKKDKEDRLSQLSFETPVCQDESESGGIELDLRESLQTAVEDDWIEMARKELGCAKKTSCVLQLQ